MAIALGCMGTPSSGARAIVLTTVLEAISMIEMEAESKFATNARCPSGVPATDTGRVPTATRDVIWYGQVSTKAKVFLLDSAISIFVAVLGLQTRLVSGALTPE